MRRYLPLSFMVMTTLATSVGTVGAQTLRLSLAELSREADAVVVGKTIRTESYWTPDSTAIMTRVTVRVEDTIAGTASGDATITVPGGQVGEYLHEISDMPVFETDEDVVVFVTRLASGEMIVAGGMQGKLDVIRNPVTGERTVLGGAGLLSDLANEAAPETPGQTVLGVDEEKATLPLGEFVARVKRVERER